MIENCKGVNIGDSQDEANFGTHRSGWRYAVESLRKIHNPDASVFLDTFIERTFAFRSEGITQHSQPWIGIIHVPYQTPEWLRNIVSNQAIFATSAWQQSLPFCKGLFTLSEYHKNALTDQFDFPIESLIHPTEIPRRLWSWRAFKNNKQKRLIQLGKFLRKLHAIYMLPNSEYIKTFLKVGNHLHFDAERELLISRGEFSDSMYSSAETLNFLTNEKYDLLLSQNIAFMDLYDASANNSVIECMARGTPLLVNPIEPVIEYLGDQYPFYYSSYEEALSKASDLSLVRKTHKYLLKHPVRKKLSGKYFMKSLNGSQIFKELGLKT